MQRAGKRAKARSKKAARRKVVKLRKKATARIQNVSKLLRRARKTVKRLVKKFPPVLPSKIQAAKNKVTKLKAKLLSVKGQRSEINLILKQIKSCGKIPTIGNGSNVLQIGTTEVLPKSGWQAYAINALHVFPISPQYNRNICVRKDGVVNTQRPLYAVCYNFQDGPSTPSNIRRCFSSKVPSGYAMVGVAAAVGYFHRGDYEEDLAEVQSKMGTSVEVYASNAEGRCPKS
jgi:hypothetical protein